MGSQNDFSPEQTDKRRESRYPTKDDVEVSIMPHADKRHKAKVLNVSRSGLQLELQIELQPGMMVQVVTPRRLVIFGEVRYCRVFGGVFHAGIHIEDTILSSSYLEQHASEDELALYATERGLTTMAFFRVKKLLERCPECRARLQESSEFMRRVRGKMPPG